MNTLILEKMDDRLKPFGSLEQPSGIGEKLIRIELMYSFARQYRALMELRKQYEGTLLEHPVKAEMEQLERVLINL